jgi:hypothetical protein
MFVDQGSADLVRINRTIDRHNFIRIPDSVNKKYYREPKQKYTK